MNTTRRRFLSIAGTGLAGVAAWAREAPSLRRATGWLNSEPLDLAALRSKVVLVNFWTYTCINWLRTLPYVRAWAKTYRDHGLVVVGVHTPEFSFEKNPDHVLMASLQMQVDYPVAIDSDRAIWNAFDNRYWPALYFIDAQGRIRHHQFGEGDYDRSDRVIQQLLREAGAGSINGTRQVGARGLEAAADWASLQSPENYFGAERTKNFSSKQARDGYAIPAGLALNQWALAGAWRISGESIVTRERHGRIAYRFHARDLHLVAGAVPPGPVRFRVSLDGMAPGSANGLDVDDQGYGRLAEPRLYQLIRQAGPIIDRQFEIEFLDSGAQAFSVTFG